MLLKYSVGIDISSKSFHCCMVLFDSSQNTKVIGSRKFSNNISGFENLKKWYTSKFKFTDIPMFFCMEATGVYHENLAHFLHEHKCKVSIIVPSTSSKYLDSLGLKSKTDSIDSKGLAQMGAERNLRLWNPPVKFYANLKSLTRHYQALHELRTQENNRLHAAKNSAQPSKLVLKDLEQHIRFIDKKIALIKKRISQAIDQEPEIRAKVDNICIIKGVSDLTVAVVIAETYGFELFENTKQIISFSGYDVIENQSGKRSGKTKISKKGNSRIRRAMHMPAFSVVRPDQPIFYNLYHRTFDKHFIKMKSYVAVQKKILTTIYALWKNESKFDPQYQSNQEKSSIKKVVPISSELQQVQY